MRERNAKLISGLTLGVICLVINVSSPLVPITLSDMVDAPMRFARDVTAEMFDWSGSLSLGKAILMFIPILIAVIVILVLALVATLGVWILKTAAVTNTLFLVGFLVGYKWRIPPASAVESVFVTLRNGIRNLVFMIRDGVIQGILIPISQRMDKESRTEVHTIGGLLMDPRDDEQAADSETQLPEVRPDRSSREMEKVEKARRSWFKKTQYVQEKKWEVEALKALGEVQEQEIQQMETATRKLKALEEFIRAGRRTQLIDELLEREYKIDAIKANAEVAKAEAETAEALLRKATAKHQIKQIGKPTPKAAKLDPRIAEVLANIKKVPEYAKAFALASRMLDDFDKKAAQGDPVSKFAADRIRRIIDDVLTGEL
jgi:hypothetical protein